MGPKATRNALTRLHQLRGLGDAKVLRDEARDSRQRVVQNLLRGTAAVHESLAQL
jgi:hypothetical protein